MKRKKRLEKGIESLKEQIELHENKLEKAKEEGMEELVNYYEKEIRQKADELKKKKDILDKQ